MRASLAARVARAQGAYYTATGLWPLVSMKTFERVTGPKHDDWLVKTVGLLITTVGVTLVHAGRRPRIHPEIRLLAALSAAALAAVDTVYVARRRISPVYLLDAIPELVLLGWWAWSGHAGTGERPARPRPARGSRDVGADPPV